MTDPAVIAAAFVTVITSITGATVLIVTAIGKNKRELIEATNAQTQVLEKKSDEIHTLVNGKATAAETKLTDMEKQIVALNEIIRGLQDSRVQDAKDSR
jgi:hypothetical protein